MTTYNFEEFVNYPAPAFECFAAGKRSEAKLLAKVKHEMNAPASLKALSKLGDLPRQVSEQLEAFYKRHNGFTLYQDTLSEAAGIKLFGIEEWQEVATEMRNAYEHLEENEDPDCVIDGLVIGEVFQSGNYFVIPVRGPRIGKVFYVDHDGWYEDIFAEDFDEFLSRIIQDPAHLLSEELGCYTRYSDGETNIQWIPEKYINSILPGL